MPGLRSSRSPSSIPVLRAARGIAQADLAKAIGVSTASVSNIERGRIPLSPELRDQIASALGCSPEVVAGARFSVISAAGQIRIEP